MSATLTLSEREADVIVALLSHRAKTPGAIYGAACKAIIEKIQTSRAQSTRHAAAVSLPGDER